MTAWVTGVLFVQDVLEVGAEDGGPGLGEVVGLQERAEEPRVRVCGLLRTVAFAGAAVPAGQAALHTGDQSGLEISATVDRAYTPCSRCQQVLRLAREVFGPLFGRAAEHLGLTGHRIPTAEAAEGLAAWVGGIVEATRLEDRTRTPTLYGACCG
ncbi:hypothetical protein ACGFZG_26995 [Streptomyces antibioticus]|uniref:hypothetical protein n=1 Tax=Streptomyces antibioticus TaxID=1890 RepID=UPI0036F95BB4